MYSLKGHGNMIADEVRTGAYERALRAAVKPGSVVADIGTGVGIFAILAARFGARRVYAIEASDMIEVARATAAANRCADRIEFIHDHSTRAVLRERVDVVVSDLHGVLPFFQGHLVAIADARKRFLAPGGVMIPARDTLYVACIEAAELHRPVTSPWFGNRYGIDMGTASQLAANQWRRALVEPSQLISAPVRCGDVDYATVDQPDFEATVEIVAERDAAGHGFCIWFDSTLGPNIRFSNAPGEPGLVYGSGYFPWPNAVNLRAGDRITLRLRATLLRGEYLWSWETQVARDDVEVARYRQSEFFGEPLAHDKVRRHAATYVAELSDDGQIDAAILLLMRDSLPLGEIARRIATQYPAHFTRWHDALARVAELSARYSRAT